MGFLHDLLLEAKGEQFEKDLKEAYGMGFRDGRLCGPDLRPCLADGKPATFHRWVDDDRAVLQVGAFVHPRDRDRIFREFQEVGLIDSSSHIEKISATFALVEYPDGSVGKVKPVLIQFLDRGEG